METLPLELRKLGLTEKEANVYLAALKLGHTSVQNIAKLAGFSRPTTYEIIKKLERKKLIQESKTGKKNYFSAASPDILLGILRTQKREIEEKEREFIRIISALRAKYYLSEKSEIRIYQDKEGLKVLLDDFSQTQSKEIFALTSKDFGREKIYRTIRQRLGQIEIKEILANREQTLKLNLPYVRQKFLALKNFSDQTLIIYEKAIIISWQKPHGFSIENETVVNLLKNLFLTIWSFKKEK